MNDLTGTAALIALRKAGGGSSTLITKTIEANGVYEASDDNADGYSQVTVDVSEDTEYGWFTDNGVYSLDEGLGYYSVEVDVEVDSSVDIRPSTPINDIMKIACPSTKVYDSDINSSVCWYFAGWVTYIETGTFYDGSYSWSSRTGGAVTLGTVRPQDPRLISFTVDTQSHKAIATVNYGTPGEIYKNSVRPYGSFNLPADHWNAENNRYEYGANEDIIGTVEMTISEYFGDTSHQMRLVN